MYQSWRHSYARRFCNDVFFIPHCIFHNRIKIGDVQRITPNKAQDFLKIVSVRIIEVYGFSNGMIPIPARDAVWGKAPFVLNERGLAR